MKLFSLNVHDCHYELVIYLKNKTVIICDKILKNKKSMVDCHSQYDIDQLFISHNAIDSKLLS